MIQQAEFLLVALALYLWESCLWVPLRAVVVRARRRGGARVMLPDGILTLRQLGLVMFSPWPADWRLAPCQVPPLVADDAARLGAATDGAGNFAMLGQLGWEDLRLDGKDLLLGTLRLPLGSPRAISMLSRARRRGLTPATAVALLWRTSLSPARARREWRRWQRVHAPLRALTPALAAAFFVGLPAAYLFAGALPALWMVLLVWVLMGSISLQLFWLGRRVYPAARSALRGDALLALLVPFHAMRALELASVHAFATTHPAAMLLALGEHDHPWLARWLRAVRVPRPENAGDHAHSFIAGPLATAAIAAAAARQLESLATSPPAAAEDAARWCPRCHALYTASAHRCGDCHGLALRDF